MTGPQKPKTHEWAVRYRRIGAAYPQVRFFQSREAAYRFVMKLTRGGRPALPPLVEIRVDIRKVQPWEIDWEVLS